MDSKSSARTNPRPSEGQVGPCTGYVLLSPLVGHGQTDHHSGPASRLFLLKSIYFTRTGFYTPVLFPFVFKTGVSFIVHAGGLPIVLQHAFPLPLDGNAGVLRGLHVDLFQKLDEPVFVHSLLQLSSCGHLQDEVFHCFGFVGFDQCNSRQPFSRFHLHHLLQHHLPPLLGLLTLLLLLLLLLFRRPSIAIPALTCHQFRDATLSDGFQLVVGLHVHVSDCIQRPLSLPPKRPSRTMSHLLHARRSRSTCKRVAKRRMRVANAVGSRPSRTWKVKKTPFEGGGRERKANFTFPPWAWDGEGPKQSKRTFKDNEW